MTDTHVIEDDAGTITVSPAVLSTVVQRCAEEADGARVRRPRRGLDIEIANGRARVALELTARYGVVLPDLAHDVQRRVTDGLSTMCGLSVSGVDVSVEELEDA